MQINNEPVRFLVVSVVNTIATYILYLFLLTMFEYTVAYSISYLVGILISYVLASGFVFNVSLSWTKLFIYPLVYLAQYLVALFVLSVLVDKFTVSERLSPLIVLFVTFPITFLISKFLLKRPRAYKYEK